jgi:hypothetical protein
MKFFNELMFVAIFEIYSYLMYLLCHLKLLCSKMVLSVNMLDLGLINIDISPM